MFSVVSGSLLPREEIPHPDRTVYFNPLYGAEYFEVLIRRATDILSVRAPAETILSWAADMGFGPYAEQIIRRIRFPQKTFAGLSLERPLVMGIVNVTPDSFSNRGRWDTAETGMQMLYAGADLLDVGGESTRPGAECVDPEEEAGRVLPVVEELVHSGAVVSVDTRKSLVAAGAIRAGAQIINDVSAFTYDPKGLDYVSQEPDVCVILMHAQGTPETMQDNPVYTRPSLDIFDYLAGRIEACERAGIFRNRICIDPGVGFGKTTADNCEILSRLGLFRGLGCPVMLGVSRKRFIAECNRGEETDARLPGSLAAALAGVNAGADVLRVHDTAETVQALAVAQKIKEFR